jgi:hypothetical protein
MGTARIASQGWLLAAAVSAAIALAGCGSKEPAPPQAGPAPTAEQAAAGAAPAADAAPAAAPLAATDQSWSPEALEALLAPVALYPDPVLSQVLMASTNPQEVLDAGNWLIANPEVEGKALDQAAEAAGFTPPMRGLMQFRAIVDQMCLEMGWTAELGQAFTNDQAGVLDAVQRLRVQAMDAGNLQDSEQMNVETQSEGGQQAVVITPPSPEVVYVPTYDPVAVYAPAPAVATAPAPMTTPTAVEEKDKGHSTGTLVTTGLLAFGAGMLVNEIFDDDDDYYKKGGYYYPNYYGGYMPPPPPYYYRPNYGGGYRPGYNYNRPPSYNNVLSNNNVVVVNRDKNSNYWNNFDDRPTGKQRSSSVQSPITKAKPNRPELAQLNQEAKAPRQRASQAASGAGKQDWKGQGGYAGASADARAKANLPPASKATAGKAAANAEAARAKAPAAAADRGYAGAPKAKSAAASRPEAASKAKTAAASRPEAASKAKSAAASRPEAASKAKSAATNRPDVATAAKSKGVSKPASMPTAKQGASAGRATAASGSARGSADRAASQRGKQSLPQGAKSKAGAAKKKR